ncbi:MAG TPA: hypothetical protein VFM77_07850 [Terriglobales bacterium]|nr:hypothetical protein [Terriglobales bacterium]
MTELRIGDQFIRFDRQATIAVYSAISQGDAERCGCQGCRNFIIQRNAIYPREFRDLLTKIGIEVTKEGEAVHEGPKDNAHFYSGWFYFFGEVIEKGESCVSLGENFKYFVRTALHPPKAFGNMRAAVEFSTVLPWLLAEPYDPELDVQIRTMKDITRRYAGALRKLANTDD